MQAMQSKYSKIAPAVEIKIFKNYAPWNQNILESYQPWNQNIIESSKYMSFPVSCLVNHKLKPVTTTCFSLQDAHR